MMGLSDAWMYGMFVFLSTIVVYNAQRMFKLKEHPKTDWMLWLRKHYKAMVITLVILGTGALYFLYDLLSFNAETMGLLGVVAFFSAFYIVRVAGKNLRTIPYIKIHVISITWSLVIIVFPLLNESLNAHVFGFGLAHYYFVLAVTIPFDIRDLKYDDSSYRTIPQVFGVKGAKLISILSLIIFSGIMINIQHDLKGNGLFWLTQLIIVILVLGMDRKRGDFYCAGIIDGAIALLGISYWLN